MSEKRSSSMESIEKRFKRNRLTSYTWNELDQLNDLVLLNCVSHLPLMKGIAQERVNRRFANALKPSYCRQRVSMKIYFDMPNLVLVGNGSVVLFAVELTGRRLFDNKFAPKFESGTLRLVLGQIFERFKCFRQLSLHQINGNFIVKNVAKAALPFSSPALDVRRLWFNPGSCDIKNASRLIAGFSPSLKVLHMYVGDDADADDYFCPSVSGAASQQLWSTVSTCTQLKRLIWSPINKHETENIYLRDCLKNLPIEVFKYNNRCFNADWLRRSFEDNDRLRYLSTGNVEIFCSRNLQPILARLTTFAVCHGTRSDRSSIVQIAQAIHRDAFLVALESLCSADDVDHSIVVISNALAFWLRLSDETTKSVKLTFGIFHGVLRSEVVDRTMEQLLAMDTFDGCELHKTNGCKKLLRWRKAKVSITFVDGYNVDLFDSW